ncbi:MAG: protein-L-isoaspartate(D-aspartate) O-methyltransferase [Limisphaerales bacterium]|jgi:protein-L-isoaspartate(D-aspartate) O-methyltransferase
MLTDNYRHQGLRKKLVDFLQNERGISDPDVLTAIGNVPRHLFLDAAFLNHAYEDKAFQIGEGQTISQPYTVAYQSMLLKAKKGMTLLEIGTGSGYQASVLCEMGIKVYSIERHRPLFELCRKRLDKLGYGKIKTKYGDGFLGWPAFAQYDRILITAAAPELPRTLIDQLKPGGIMVIPYDHPEVKGQIMMRITKTEEGQLMREEFEQFRFVPMLKGKV